MGTVEGCGDGGGKTSLLGQIDCLSRFAPMLRTMPPQLSDLQWNANANELELSEPRSKVRSSQSVGRPSGS
jgi:hypothetical protein